MSKKGFVIKVEVAKSILWYNAKTKCCSTDLRLATIYSNKKSAAYDINDKKAGCTTGQVLSYEKAVEMVGINSSMIVYGSNINIE